MTETNLEERWQNVYKDNGIGRAFSARFRTKEQADGRVADDKIRTHYLKTYWLDSVIQPELSEWIKIEKE